MCIRDRSQDVTDWKSNLKDHEKNVVGQILKGFAQTETIVNDYWSTLVTKWFRKPEVIMMGTTLGSSETIHAEAYSLLNEQLGLDLFGDVYHKSERLLNNLNERDRQLIADELDANESSNTLN